MDILNIIKQLRDDIKTWVTNNLNVLNTKISNKVDKEKGKGLSTNDFTNEYKEKLDELNFAGSGDVILREDGGYYVPSISQPNADTMQVEFTPSKSDMAAVTPQNITLPKGNTGVGIVSMNQDVVSTEDGGTNLVNVVLSNGTSSQFTFKNGSKGSNGHTPVIEANPTTDGFWISVDGEDVCFIHHGQDGNEGTGIYSIERTNGNGSAGTTDTYTITYTSGLTDTFTVYNGKDGQNGKDGVSASHSWNGTILTITSASGTSYADLKGDTGNSGVYVGTGTPSNGENVQIDPTASETFTIPDVLQTTGNSEVDTMSQKAITEALQNIEAMIVNGNEVSY